MENNRKRAAFTNRLSHSDIAGSVKKCFFTNRLGRSGMAGGVRRLSFKDFLRRAWIPGNAAFCLILVCILVFGMALPVRAEDRQVDSSEGSSEKWTVTFDGSKLDSNFKSNELSEAAAGLQPGDSVTFIVAMKNASSDATDWWMTNKVLTSFEDNSVANGGAYTYVLTYTDSDGNADVLYSSESVGGEDTTGGAGLHQATGALEDYFYVDTLAASSGTGTITLKVALDGETQGNNYQNTLADLQMNFAVELAAESDTDVAVMNRPDSQQRQADTESTERETGTATNTANTTAQTAQTTRTTSTTTHSDIVRTEDDTRLAPYLIMGGCGLLFLLLAILSMRRRRGAEEKGAV